MLFNSLEFALFFLVVYSLYVVSNHKWQNRLLLLSSYIFYGSWDWRFLSLIIISTIIDYHCGIRIHSSSNLKIKKLFLTLSLFANLFILGVFKYLNFFIDSLHNLVSHFGIQLSPQLIHIVLPVGISFYTFQTMSYTIDIYRKELKPTNHFFDFALFVSFFPQLVAGPIERAKHLLPQILEPRKIDSNNFFDGGFLIFWGIFQKIFVADNLAKVVDPIFSASSYNGASVLIALYAFAFQIFCDFAGYSNIARGLAKMMGIDLMVNFNLPYFSTNPSEFWRRWHISLSTWLRDYLYIPLGGKKYGNINTCKNLALTMLIGGLWHGASWTFVAWGAYQGGLLILYKVVKSVFNPKLLNLNKFLALRIFCFFNLICFGWLLFRAQSMNQAIQMTQSLFFNFDFKKHELYLLLKTVAIILPLFLIQIGQYKTRDLLFLYRQHWFVRTASYALLSYLVLVWGVMGSLEFIYFQF